MCNARIRNTELRYAEQLARAEKAALYELSQLCEQYGVSMEAFYVHLRNSERLWETLKRPTGVREAMEMMGAAPRRRSESYLALLIVAMAAAIVLVGVLSSLHS